MLDKQKLGRIGEDIAVKYLVKRKYRIIERNFKCKIGEIDIIAKDKDELVFIEVKSRTSNQYGNPVDAVNENKQKHIHKSAEYYVYINGAENEYIRFEVIEIYFREK